MTADASISARATQKAIKAKQGKLKVANQALIDLNAEFRLQEIGAPEYAILLKRLQQERDAIVAKLEVLKAESDQAHERQTWGKWVAEWGKAAPKANLTPEQRKQYLSGLIERIEVWFKSDTKEHVLELKFARAISGDAIVERGSSRWRVPGIGAVKLHAGVPSRGKRLTPVGKRSTTVE